MVVAPSLNVYLIPGMSADAASFASLDWDEQIFVPIVLPWLEPQNKETYLILKWKHFLIQSSRK